MTTSKGKCFYSFIKFTQLIFRKQQVLLYIKFLRWKKSAVFRTWSAYHNVDMREFSAFLRTATLGLTLLVASNCASGNVLFPPPSAFYPFPTWVPYPPNYYQQFRPPSNFTNNGTAFNNTYYWRDQKYFYPPYNNSFNHSVSYGGNLFVGYIWPVDRLLFNQVRNV